MATLKTTFQDIETDSEVCVAVFLIIGHLGDNFEISIKQITAEDFTDKKMEVTEFIRKYTEQRKVSTNYTQLQRNVIPYLLSQPVHAMEAVEDGYCVSYCVLSFLQLYHLRKAKHEKLTYTGSAKY